MIHITAKTLRFRIEHNETVASDISEVLSLMHLPWMQHEARRPMTPPHLVDSQSADVYNQLTRMSNILLLNKLDGALLEASYS